jgi:hypothetical protein
MLQLTYLMLKRLQVLCEDSDLFPEFLHLFLLRKRYAHQHGLKNYGARGVACCGRVATAGIH